MKVRPVGDRLLVRREEAAAVSKGGLHIPEQAKDPTQIGIVLAVGEGRGFDEAGGEVHETWSPDFRHGAPAPPDAPLVLSSRTTTLRNRLAPIIKAGDRILFGKFSGTEVTVDEEQLFLLREDEVVAVLEEDGLPS